MDPLPLSSAFGVRDRDVVSLVGGGGKTSLMVLLAAELCRSGRTIVVTTTTKVFLDEVKTAGQCLLGEDLESILADIRHRARCGTATAVATSVDGEGKLKGIPDWWVESIAEIEGISNVIVEADGAAGRPLKGPVAHEPAIPSASTLVLAVIGLDVIGKPLTSQFVHRPEVVARLTGLELGDNITPEASAMVLTCAQGSTKGAPEKARIVAIINKVDCNTDLPVARDVASEVLRLGFTRVILTSCRRQNSVVEILEHGILT
jgi:probable selenium-dependent hydroxylase accessory protein YqeC